MLAVFAAVLALAGAPPSTQVECVPSFSNPASLGVAWFYPAPFTIHLRGDVCLGVLYAGADGWTRAGLAYSNPGAIWVEGVGRGMLVALHEAEHAALQSFDECLVEKVALAKLPVLLKRFMPRQWREALVFARQYDDGLPSSYHGC